MAKIRLNEKSAIKLDFEDSKGLKPHGGTSPSSTMKLSPTLRPHRCQGAHTLGRKALLCPKPLVGRAWRPGVVSLGE